LISKQLISVSETTLIGFTPDVDSSTISADNYHRGSKWLDAAEFPVVT